MPLVKEDFNREKHVYKNKKFSELLLDAVRFFHGTPVLPLPPNEPFKGAGVYAIYCIARSGIYKVFGETINQRDYILPIYVGYAGMDEHKTKRATRRFGAFPLGCQLSFWFKALRVSADLSPCDFMVRVIDSCSEIGFREIAECLRHDFSPIWNTFFKQSYRIEGMERTWRLLHDLRFHKKGTSPEVKLSRQRLQTALDRIARNFAA